MLFLFFFQSKILYCPANNKCTQTLKSTQELIYMQYIPLNMHKILVCLVLLKYRDDVIKWEHLLLALCAGNSQVTGEFPPRRPVTRSLGVFFDLRLNKRLSKQSWGWWFETPSRWLWHHCNVLWVPSRLSWYFDPKKIKRMFQRSTHIYMLWDSLPGLLPRFWTW